MPVEEGGQGALVHSLLIIVALGETIVSIATPQTELEHLTWADLGGLAATFVLVGGLWWAYFRHSLGLMEHYINRARVPFRAVRSLLAYGHLALAAGLIALAASPHMSGMLLVSLLALIPVAECLWETLAPAGAGVPDLAKLADRAAQA